MELTAERLAVLNENKQSRGMLERLARRADNMTRAKAKRAVRPTNEEREQARQQRRAERVNREQLIKSLRQQNEAVIKARMAADAQAKAATEATDAAQAAFDTERTALQSEVATTVKALKDARAKLKEQEAKLANAVETADKYGQAADGMLGKLNTAKAESQTLAERVKDLGGQVELLRRDLTAAQTENADLKRSIEGAAAENTRLTARIKELT